MLNQLEPNAPPAQSPAFHLHKDLNYIVLCKAPRLQNVCLNIAGSIGHVQKSHNTL